MFVSVVLAATAEANNNLYNLQLQEGSHETAIDDLNNKDEVHLKDDLANDNNTDIVPLFQLL